MSPRGTHFENLLFPPAMPGDEAPVLVGSIMAINHRQGKKNGRRTNTMGRCAGRSVQVMP
jgi:hypothetical protein